MKNLFDPRLGAADRSSVPARKVAIARATLRGVLAALLLFVSAGAAPLHAASGESKGPSSDPFAKAAFPSLTYDGFTGGFCSQDEFRTDVTAHYDVVGLVNISGTTFLNGSFYDAYAFTETGPAAYVADFKRVFIPPLASSTYRFDFQSVVRQGTRVLGTSATTIFCTNGVLTAASLWMPYSEPIPVLPPAPLGMLVLLMAVAGLARLRNDRA